VGHWIPGRAGNVFVVQRPKPRSWSVYKWVSDSELRLIRDRLQGSIVPTPRLIRWWPAQPDLPAAVELEYIGHLATTTPCYHFAPESIPFSSPDWLEDGLSGLVKLLAQVHRASRAETNGLRPLGPADDEDDFRVALAKLEAVKELPGGKRWHSFWTDHQRTAETAFAAAHALPATWLWGDAKWDHVGRKEDGSLVLLEWSDLRGPGGSDLFLSLFLGRRRRDEIVGMYAEAAEVAERDVRKALLRSCFVHGPGLSCLAVRGVAAGESSDTDRRFWRQEAETVAEAIDELSG